VPVRERSLRAPCTRCPSARVALQSRLIGNSHGAVIDVQPVTATLHLGVLEANAGLFD
jgi:hypothetical protein